MLDMMLYGLLKSNLLKIFYYEFWKNFFKSPFNVAEVAKRITLQGTILTREISVWASNKLMFFLTSSTFLACMLSTYVYDNCLSNEMDRFIFLAYIIYRKMPLMRWSRHLRYRRWRSFVLTYTYMPTVSMIVTRIGN